MNQKRAMLLVAFMMLASCVFAQPAVKTESIKVYGNCGMCKSRIEKALKTEGISTAVWNTQTKILRVAYDPQKISIDSIQKKIVAVGHDTEEYSAGDEVYTKLPGCCKYDRKKTTNQKK